MTRISNLIKMFKNTMSVFKKPPPVQNSAEFGEFLATRSAFICQKTLYGYVKTRMGMQYPKMFEDQVFIDSLNMSKWRLYAACLSDLAIFMSAQTFAKTGDSKLSAEIARHWHHQVITTRFEEADYDGDAQKLRKKFEKRLALTDWKNMIEGEGAFKESPPALIRWAPIEDKLKEFDEPLVLNSIRFQWQAVRRDFRDVFDVEHFLADWANWNGQG